MNCWKYPKIAKTISTSLRKNERNCKQKCPKEENKNLKIDLPNIRKIQVRGTQTTLSTTMAWQGMWSNSKDCPDNLSSKQTGISSCQLSPKRTSSESRKSPSKVSIYKNMTVRKTPYSRFKSSSLSKGKSSGSHSSSTLSMTPCSEASSDLIEVGEIYETSPIEDCIVGHIGVQTDLFASEYPQYGNKTNSRRNKIVLRTSQIWGSKRKQLRSSTGFSSNHVNPQALNAKNSKPLNTISTQKTGEFNLLLKKSLQDNKIQNPTDSSRNSDEATTLSVPEQCFFFPEDQLTHVSSSLELVKQPVSPSTKEGLDFVLETRATQFTPSLTGIPEERHEIQEAGHSKERTLSDLSKRVEKYDVPKGMFTTPSNPFSSSKFSSTALTISHDDYSYTEQNLPQMEQKLKETIDSQLLQHYRMKIQFQSGEANPSITTPEKLLRSRQESVPDLRNDQCQLKSYTNSQGEKEIAQFEKITHGLGELPQANLLTTLDKMDLPIEPLIETNNNSYDPNTKMLGEADRGLPNRVEHPKSELTLQSDKLEPESGGRFHGDMKVNVNENTTFKSLPKSLSMIGSIPNTDKKQYPPLVQPSTKSDKQESQITNICESNRTESKKKEPFLELQTMRTPTKYSRPNESGIYPLNKRFSTCSTEPNTPVSTYSLPQRPITKPTLSENSKSHILRDTLDKKDNNFHRTNALINQKSNSTINENQRQKFIFTRDRQISPFVRYMKPDYQTFMGSTETLKKFGISLHRRRPPLRTRRIVNDLNKNPLLTRHLPVRNVTNDFLKNKENRAFSIGHLMPFKNINSITNCPTQCTVIEKKNVNIPVEKKVSQQISSQENKISVPVKCEKWLHPPATLDVPVKPQDSLTQEGELIVDTMSHNDEVRSNTTDNSRSMASQTIVSVRNINVAGAELSTTTSNVTYGDSSSKTKKSYSSPEFWKSLVLPRHVQKCLSLSQIDTDGATLPVTKHISNTQSVYTVSSESCEFQTYFNYLGNDVSQFSESSGSRKSLLKTSHSLKLKHQSSTKLSDKSIRSVNKNPNIRSHPEISNRRNKTIMSNEERMVQRLKREESIRQWVLKKQGKSSPNAKLNLWDTGSKRTKRSSSTSPRTPTKQENKMNPAIELKHSHPMVLMENKSRHSEDSCSSKIKGKNSTSENHTKYLRKDLETKKTLVPQKRKEKIQLKSTYINPELNSCRSKVDNDSIPEGKSQIIEKNTDEKGLHCELHITSQTSCATVCTQASELSEEDSHGIQKRNMKATKSLKQRGQSHLKTPVPVSVVTLDPLPLYSMTGTSEGNFIFQRVSKTVPKESQTEDSRVSTQTKSSNPQKKHQDELQHSLGRWGQFIPRPFPPPNHVRGLKRPVTRSSSNFEKLKPQGSEHSVKVAKKCGNIVKDTQPLTRSVPPIRNSKLKESRRTTSSTSQTEDHLIKVVSEKHTTENKKDLESMTKSMREKVNKPGQGGETEDNISPTDTDRSRDEVASKACQTDRNNIYPKSKEKDGKDRKLSCGSVFQDNNNSTRDRFSKLLNTNFLRYVNQNQKPGARFPKVQHIRVIKSTGNKFRNWDKIDEATSEQEKDCSSEKNSSLGHSKYHTSHFHRNFNEIRVPSSSRRVHFHRTSQNLQQQYPHVYQQERRNQLSMQTRGEGFDRKKDERSDTRSEESYPHKEKSLPTKEFLSSKRAKRILISKFSDIARKLGESILHKNHLHHSTSSSQSGSKSRGSFESSSYSSRLQNGRRSRRMRYITSPKSTALYMNRNCVSNFDSPSHTEDEDGFPRSYESVLEQISSTSVDSHHFQSSYSKSSSNFQEDVSRYSKGVQCNEAEPSGYVNNRESKFSYTIFKMRPDDNENIYWDDSVTRQKSKNSYHDTSSKNITTIFQKNDTHSQPEKFNKDFTTKYDKNRRLRDRTPSY